MAYSYYQSVETDANEKLNKIIKACKIISDMLPNPYQNYQIEQNMKDVIPKLVKNLHVLPVTVIYLLD